MTVTLSTRAIHVLVTHASITETHSTRTLASTQLQHAHLSSQPVNLDPGLHTAIQNNKQKENIFHVTSAISQSQHYNGLASWLLHSLSLSLFTFTLLISLVKGIYSPPHFTFPPTLMYFMFLPPLLTTYCV